MENDDNNTEANHSHSKANSRNESAQGCLKTMITIAMVLFGVVVLLFGSCFIAWR